MNRINKKTILVLICLSFLFLSTCTKDVYAPSACFRENILPIFISNCTMSKCHNSSDKSAGYDLTTYEGIMHGVKPKHPLFSEVYNTIKGNNPSMPRKPYPKLSQNDINLIKLWIESGAENTSNCKACDTLNFTYSNRVKPILQTWCIGCHTEANNVNGNVSLVNYNDVLNVAFENRFLGSIKHLPGFSPMPKNTDQISACEITVIQKWVNSGCPNN